MKPTLAAKFTINQYWDGVVAHELGHTLGLDHTGYQADLMYAATSSGNMIAKYIWKKNRWRNLLMDWMAPRWQQFRFEI